MIFDIIVIVVLLASALIAFMRGFIRETLTILGVVGGLFAAYQFGGSFVPKLEGMLGVIEGEKPEKLLGILPMDMVALGLAYGLVFGTVVIVLSIASHFLAESVKSMGLGAIDRTLGVIFGLVRGIILLGIAYLPFYLLMSGEDKEAWFGSSRSYFYIDKTASVMAGFIPNSNPDEVRAEAQEFKGIVSTRERLQQIDLLKKEIPSELLDAPRDETGEGYQQDFRDNMDQLFEQKAGDYNE